MFMIIPLNNINPAKSNYRKRFDPEKMKEMTASVKDKGVLEPILVRALKGKANGQFEVVAGTRRFTAAMNAGLDEIPAIVKDLTDEEVLEIQIVENCQREDPNPMDEAEGFKRLLDMGHHTPETLSEKIGRSITYVLSRLKLVDLDEEVRKAISSGEIGMGHAVLFTRLQNHDDQKQFLKNLHECEWSVRHAKSQLDHYYSNDISDAVFDTGDCATCAFRSRNQTVLFPDLSDKDTCSDKNCFFLKTRGHYKMIIDRKALNGLRVFRLKEDVDELISYKAENSVGITGNKDMAGWVFKYPAKYETKCAECTKHHAWFMYEDKDYSGPTVKFGEICLNKKCLDKMQVGEEKQQSKEKDSGSPTPATSQWEIKVAAKRCLRRFSTRKLALAVESQPVLTDRLIIMSLLSYCDYFSVGDAETEKFFKEFAPEYMDDVDEVDYYEKAETWPIIESIPVNRLGRAIEKLTVITLSDFSEEVLTQMLPGAGVHLDLDFFVDREWLETKTKSELLALIDELGLGIKVKSPTEKKLIDAILEQNLAGKIPAEIAAVLKPEKAETEDSDGENEEE